MNLTSTTGNIILLADLIAVNAIKSEITDYTDYLPVIDKSLDVIDKSQQHSYKPGILGLKAKYYIYGDKQLDMAEKYYNEAIMFALILGESLLAEELKKEKERDGI